MQQNWKFRRGDIYYVQFGNTSTGSEQHGDRPAVIIQNDVGNTYAPTLIVVPLTSNTEKKVTQPTHCLLENEGLSMSSMALAEQIFTIDKSRILKYLGHLAPEDMQRLDYALKNSLALNPLGSIRKLKPIIRSTAAYDIFSTEESRQEEKREQVQQIPIAELFPFKNHPFKVLDDESMQRTVESVEQYGVLSPLIARPRPEGGYEIISGHRRQHAAQLAGLETLPVIVREMDDDAAILLMVDSNLQRESILPSERAFAYKMKLEAMKRTSGRPSKENASQIGTQKRSDQLMAEELGESRNQIQRFIRLTNLIPELLNMVDEKKISFNPAVELSYLDEAQQRDFLEAMNDTQNFPSLSQAQRLKKLAQEGHFSYDVAFAVMGEEKKDELDKVVIKNDTLRKYFPRSYTPKQMEDTIIKLLEQWQRKLQRQNER